MTKAVLEKMIKQGKDNGIENFIIRDTSGNSIFYNNENSIVKPLADGVAIFEVSRNYGQGKGQYSMTFVPYDCIMFIKFDNMSIKETLDLANANGMTADINKLIKANHIKTDIIPGTAGLAPIAYKDPETGKITTEVPAGVPGYITSGTGEIVEDVSNSKNDSSDTKP